MGRTPYLHKVPKNVAQNLAWRARWWKESADDVALQDGLRHACYQDVLFWFNAFCWCFEPRSVHKIRPFITWPHQDPCILKMDEAITLAEQREEPTDLVVDKSRGQGATWMFLMVFLRRWLRDPMFSAGVVSRNEDTVDSATDPDTLLWKINWMLKQLPYWMLPEGFDFKQHRSLTDHSFLNPENKATIVGYSAVSDLARGGRKTVFGMDEFGSDSFIIGGKDYKALDSTQYVTNCRFLISTYSRTSGAFYDAATGDSSAEKVILDWKDNPTQNRVLYKMRNGKLEALDPAESGWVQQYSWKQKKKRIFRRLEHRGHKLEGKVRSPWYDSQCLRTGASPRSIAKELDRNPQGIVGKVFDGEVLDRMSSEKVRPPVWQGRPLYDEREQVIRGLVQQDNGPLKLWFRPSADLKVPSSVYALGCDIAAGTAGITSSNSVTCGIDRRTGEQVLEYANPGISATRFGRLNVVFAKWFCKAFLAWEASGPFGIAFGKEVESLNYVNVYRAPIQIVGLRSRTQAARPGWWNMGDEAKGQLFEGLGVGMAEDAFTPRSEDLIRECKEYEWEKGKIIHRPSKEALIDGKAHGDRCIAAGVAWLALQDRPVGSVDTDTEIVDNPPYGSFAWRQAKEDAEKYQWSDDRPQFSLDDLLRPA